MMNQADSILSLEPPPRTRRGCAPIAPLLVVMPTYPPAHSGGGLRIHRQMRRLRHRIPFPVQVLSAAGRGLSAGQTVQDEIPVFRIGTRRSLGMFFRMGVYLVRHRPAMIHSAGDTLFNYSAGIWAWMLHIPLIKERTMNSDFFQSRLRRALFQFVHTHAQLCIALNRSIADQFRQVGVKEEQIFCRPNPVDCAVFRRPSVSEKKRARFEAGIDPAVFNHVVVGRFCPRKNQLQAVVALSGLPENHHLLLVGPVFAEEDTRYLETIRDQIATLNLEERVVVRPESVHSIVEVYHAADSLWIPSVAEGTPNVMLEALCTGLPVFLNQALNLHEFVEDGVNGRHVDFSDDSFPQEVEALFSTIDSMEISDNAIRAYAAERIDELYIDRMIQAKLIPDQEGDGC